LVEEALCEAERLRSKIEPAGLELLSKEQFCTRRERPKRLATNRD